jgi:hypothetical protein
MKQLKITKRASFGQWSCRPRFPFQHAIGAIRNDLRCYAFQHLSAKGNRMDRPSIFLTLILGSVVTGALIIVVLSIGWYSWPAIGGAAAAGFLLTWPLSFVVSRRNKRQDPHWDDTKIDRVEGVIPDPAALEV